MYWQFHDAHAPLAVLTTATIHVSAVRGSAILRGLSRYALHAQSGMVVDKIVAQAKVRRMAAMHSQIVDRKLTKQFVHRKLANGTVVVSRKTCATVAWLKVNANSSK